MNRATKFCLPAALALIASMTFAREGLAQDPPPASAAAETRYDVDGGSLRVVTAGGPRAIDLGCEARSVVRVDRKLYVACGGGVVRLDLGDPAAPTVDGKVPVEGEAVSIFLLDGKPWVQVARREAKPIEGVAPGLGLGSVATVPSGASPAPPFEPSPASSGSASPSRAAPARIADVWELSLATSAFLPLGTIGFGALGDGEVARRFEAPIAIHAMVNPIGYASGKEGGTGTASGLGVITVDSHLLELGLGAGAVTLASRRTTESVAVAQYTRIGARDGVAFDARTTVVVDNDEFEFGSFDGALQFPLAPRWLMILRGGGGQQGYVYGDAGAKYRLTETRGEGAFSLLGGLGAAGIRGEGSCANQASFSYCPSVSYAGPSIRLGVELRL